MLAGVSDNALNWDDYRIRRPAMPATPVLLEALP
jgi:hypothetical protein